MDSKYTFLVLHGHAATWKERHFLTANGSHIKYHKEINQLLCSVYLSSKVTITPCKCHQKGTDEVSEGKRLAVLEAEMAAKCP